MVIVFVSELLRVQRFETQRAAFAPGTKSNLFHQWKKFQKFVSEVGPVPLPISIEDLCIYIQFLSEELAAPQSVTNYVNGLRVLHTLTDLPTTSFYLADVKLMMLGVRRLKQHIVRQAEPVTLDMLLKMSSQVDLRDISQLACWTAVLTAFFCMLRSSNLIPKSRGTFDQNKQLCRSDILRGQSCWAVKIR